MTVKSGERVGLRDRRGHGPPRVGVVLGVHHFESDHGGELVIVRWSDDGRTEWIRPSPDLELVEETVPASEAAGDEIAASS